MIPPRVLLFAPSAEDRAPVERALADAGLHAEIRVASSREALREALAGRAVDVILADLAGEADVRELAEFARAQDAAVSLVIAASTAPRTGALLRAGARDAVLRADGDHLAAVIARDAQATRRARQAAQSAERLAWLEQVIEEVPAMVFAKKAENLEINIWNKRAEELTGVPRANVLGKSDRDLFPEHAELYRKADREVLGNRVPVEVAEEPIATARGERWLYTRKVPMFGADGEPICLLGISLDITDRREAERALRESAQRLAESEGEKLELIERLRCAIEELSNPILEIWDDVLAMPIIGVVDSRRTADMVQRLLAEVARTQASFVILDLTGVEIVDTKTADHLIKLMRKVEIVGARCVLTGIRPAVAETLVDIGVDFGRLGTLRNLKHGLREALRVTKQSRNDLAELELLDDAEEEQVPRRRARARA